jgi:hypothetical protein
MSRLVRRILLLALAASLALPMTAVAAPDEAASGGAPSAVGHWLARLWEPISRLLVTSRATAGATIDPDEAAQPPQCGTSTESDQPEADGGPTIDPNG